MIELHHLPTVNETLNSVAFVLLLPGYYFIRRGRVSAHARCMVSAFCVSVLFLGSYLTYATLGEEKRFGGQGWIRPVPAGSRRTSWWGATSRGSKPLPHVR